MRLSPLWIAIALVLAGCAQKPPRVEYRNIEVPVPVPCAAPVPAAPAYAFALVPAGASLYEHVRALLVEREQRIAYERQLQAAVTSCQ